MKYRYLSVAFLLALGTIGCAEQTAAASGKIDNVRYEVTSPEISENTVRSNEPEVLEPVAGGDVVYSCQTARIDATNASEGYLYVSYYGNNPKVKLQLTGPDDVTYTYNILTQDAVIPITSGNGKYTAVFFENIQDTQYSTLFAADMDLTVSREFGPYLYPNQYVNFSKDSEVVSLGKQLAEGASSEIEVISAVYSYMINNISYDEVKLTTADKSYLPNVDEILKSKSGICFDYAAVMAAMLRSQRIPTRMEIGYAGDAYHAWISVYIEEIGWVNGMISFDGKDWTLMDPTFAANSSESALKSFIGDGSNYQTKYVY